MQNTKKRKYNVRRIRPTMSYSIQEIAEIYKIHKGTILCWHKNGLRTTDDQKPYLFYGADLIEFLRKRQATRKQICKADEFFCFKCRQPRRSMDNEVKIELRNKHRLKISGACCACKTKIYREGAVRKLNEYHKIFKIKSLPEQHIVESDIPSVNIDMGKVQQNEEIQC